MEDNCDSVNEDVFAILAYIGSLMMGFGLIYQNYKMWRHKQTRAISMKWSINYIIGLTLANIYTIINSIIPILVGGIIEQIGLFILIGYKIYIEKKFFCINWSDPPAIIEVDINDFKQITDYNSITLCLNHDKLDNISELSNSDDDIFCIKFTRQQIINMLTKMDADNNVLSKGEILKLYSQVNKSHNNSNTKLDLVLSKT
jgi:uncharacterized protein with PQ loop repeat